MPVTAAFHVYAARPPVRSGLGRIGGSRRKVRPASRSFCALREGSDHCLDELDEPAARICLGSCVLLGNEEAFERELSTYVRRFPREAEAASKEHEAFRAAVVHAAAELAGWPQTVNPFRVKDYEALGGGKGNQQ